MRPLFASLLSFLFLANLVSTTFGQDTFPDTPANHWAYDKSKRQRILLDADWRFYRGEPEGSGFVLKGVPVTNWKWTQDNAGRNDAQRMAAVDLDTSGPGWHASKTGEDTFKGRVGFSWYRTSLSVAANWNTVIHFEGVDDNATVYLNGKKLAHHEGWNDPFDVDLKPAFKPGFANVLAVLVENTAGPGGITAPVTLLAPGPSTTPAPAKQTYNDRAWRIVHLPHDFVVEGKFDPTADGSHGFLPKVTGWYRKSFTVPARDRGLSAWIDFDGVYRNSKVWLNGHFLGTHPSGYTSFRYDVAPYLRYGGKNELAVHVDPRQNEGWWYEGGGIYRHVWLNFANPIHFAPWGTFVTTSMTEPVPSNAPGPAMVRIRTRVSNGESKWRNLSVMAMVQEGDALVGLSRGNIDVPAGSSKEIVLTVRVPRPRLWSLESPNLYRATASVWTRKANVSTMIDSTAAEFGIRTIRFDAEKGFFLNGRHVEIQGTCNHQDYAGLGIAVPDTLEYWRVKKLKELGANAWRMSHNPPTPALLDACDRLGMLVMDENRHLGASPAVLGELRDMVLRDRNHPSIVMWSTCNEESAAGSAAGGRTFAAMKGTILGLDTTRPISCAMNQGWFGNGFTYVEDLMGVNYNYEVYDRFHKLHPAMPMFGSETASTVTTRGEYADDQRRTYVTSYNMTDGSWEPAGSRPFIAGTFVWTGFDYKGEPSPYGWPCVNSHFGILDMCGFPKDNYWYYQSWWKTKPVVHLMPHWNWPGKEGQNVKVVAFSNAARVELFLNGESLGSKEMPRLGHIEWDVKYQPGTLTAGGYDSAGKAVASDKVETTGGPARIQLRTDRTRLAADGEDVTVVEVSVLDAKGRIIPTADNLIHFSLSGGGKIAGVGNGNPSDHDPDHADYRHAFNGRCVVVVRGGTKHGHLLLNARSSGLPGTSLALEAR